MAFFSSLFISIFYIRFYFSSLCESLWFGAFCGMKLKRESGIFCFVLAVVVAVFGGAVFIDNVYFVFLAV